MENRIVKPLKQNRKISETILKIRDTHVILDRDLAEFFHTTTSALNQYRSRNQKRFTSEYSFQLTSDEYSYLLSQNVISNQKQGGRRFMPWVYTEHGVVLLSTGMKNDNAIELSRIIVDTFVSMRQGTLSRERIVFGEDSFQRRHSFREKIYTQMEQLLDTRLPDSSGKTLRDEIGAIASSALDHIKQVLDTPGKKNEKISAEVTKILAEAEKIYAETRKIHEETDSLALGNLQKRLELLRDFRTMAVQLERDDWFEIFDNTFGKKQLPRNDLDINQ